MFIGGTIPRWLSLVSQSFRPEMKFPWFRKVDIVQRRTSSRRSSTRPWREHYGTAIERCVIEVRGTSTGASEASANFCAHEATFFVPQWARRVVCVWLVIRPTSDEEVVGGLLLVRQGRAVVYLPSVGTPRGDPVTRYPLSPAGCDPVCLRTSGKRDLGDVRCSSVR